MGRPVKAEGSVVSDNSSGSTSSLVDDSERDKIGRQYEAGDLTLPYNKGRYDGYMTATKMVKNKEPCIRILLVIT